MSHPQDEETDRAVSRRVEHPTDATTADGPAYAAADPGPGASPGTTGGLSTDPAPPDSDGPATSQGGTATDAAREDATDADSEPTRSE